MMLNPCLCVLPLKKRKSYLKDHFGSGAETCLPLYSLAPAINAVLPITTSCGQLGGFAVHPASRPQFSSVTVTPDINTDIYTIQASLVAHTVKNLPAMQETQV